MQGSSRVKIRNGGGRMQEKKKLLKNNQTVPQQHKQNNTILKVKELTQDTQIHSSLLPSYIFLTTQA